MCMTKKTLIALTSLPHLTCRTQFLGEQCSIPTSAWLFIKLSQLPLLSADLKLAKG
jgi:hypothetical protein